MSTHDIYNDLNNIFYEILPQYGFNVRPDQARLSKHMLDALREQGAALCEAGVGTGKTHAYIMAAVLHMLDNPNFDIIRQSYPCDREYSKSTKMPIILSTSSIQLQRSITQEYIPEISRILIKHGIIKEPLTFVVRKGKSHFVCDRRLDDYLMSAPAKEDKTVYKALKLLAATDLHHIDLDEQELRPYVKSRINVPLWCNVFCPRYEKCRHNMLQTYQRQSNHHFQVCNHNYFFADLIKRSQTQKPLLPNYQAVVFDEAHKLVDAARQIYGFTLSEREIERLTEAAALLNEPRHAAIRRYMADFCRNLKDEGTGFFTGLERRVKAEQQDESDRFSVSLTVTQKRQISNIAGLLQGALTILGDKRVFANQDSLRLYVIQTVNKLIKRLDSLATPNGYILWLELPKIESGSITLNAIPKQLDKMLYDDFWVKRIPAVLTSGTISAAGSFTHFKKSLGLHRMIKDNITELTHASPFDYMNNCQLYLAADLPFPDPKDPVYLDAVTKLIGRLIEATHGHTLVLFTSYRVMELIYLRLKDTVSFPLLKVGRGVVNVIEQFRNSQNGVLFAAGSFWEGVDLPGDVLSSLIVVKLPFPQPDPLSDYERSQYESDKDYMENALIPQMLVKLKQGTGRLIRNETDTGVISILDSRLRKGGKYRDNVLRTLPKCGIANNVFDIERFIRDKKPDEYFGKGA